jgi:paraquat-inducible protein A
MNGVFSADSPALPGASLGSICACPECDLLHRSLPVPERKAAACVRCGATLKRGGRDRADITLALAITALILFGLANAFPILRMHLHGRVQEATIINCALQLFAQGWFWLGSIIFVTVELAPFTYLLGVTIVLVQVRRRRATRRTARLFRLVLKLQAWAMAEVFVLGIIVSYVKLSQMALLSTGVSLYALVGFIVITAAELSALDPATVWDAMERQA